MPTALPGPLDAELLAWAAGFFDGEGTTIARSDKGRPAYHQLDVSLPQASRAVTPEVLTKFQRAVLGVGQIYGPNASNLYRWRAGGRIGAELTLALIWPWLGAVKRAQAATAAALVDAQYERGLYQARAARYYPILRPHDRRVSTDDPSAVDRAWAAGFLDAEGCFGTIRLPPRKDGIASVKIRASASQHGEVGVPADVLLRLMTVLGVGRIERHGEPDDFRWAADGIRGFERTIELVRPWLGSVKTSQAELARQRFAARALVRGSASRCIRGHEYDRVQVRDDGRIHRRCNACARIVAREKRAVQGVKPRPFKNVARRYAA
jgi:hypothetical protein